jgi:endonuclease/exonuclease/phosphatase family metal-dependent hydrolase
MNTLDILTYNVMMLPPVAVSAAQHVRAGLIPAAIAESGDYDVVVFNEAFDGQARDLLTRGMRELGYAHASGVVDGKPGTLTNGGVFVVSRHPLLEVQQIVYADACGSDSLAGKGAQYVRLQKNGQPILLFATHLQADRGADERRVRGHQLRALSAFISDRTKTAARDGAPVLIAGDLNICAIHDADELGDALRTLGARLVGERPSGYTSDPRVNTLCKRRYPGAPQEWLDYILVSRRGIPVEHAALAVRPMRHAYSIAGAEQLDLSDHYALAARISVRTDLRATPGDDEGGALL